MGFDKQIPVVVGHHPLRPMLGWIDTHDSKPFTTHLLDARADDAIRLLQGLSLTRIRLAVRTVTRFYVIRHLDSPYSGTWKVLTPVPTAFQIADSSRKRAFLIKKPLYLCRTSEVFAQSKTSAVLSTSVTNEIRLRAHDTPFAPSKFGKGE